MPKKQRGAKKILRRGTACLLAAAGVWMAVPGESLPAWSPLTEQADGDAKALVKSLLLGDVPILARQMATDGEEEPQTHTEEADEETQLEAVTPDKIQERTITGGSGYTTGGGVTIFNRTEKTVDLDAIGEEGTSLSFSGAQEGPQVLILHTHGTESFARDGTEPYTETGTAHTTDDSYNIIRVGDEMERIFTEMGISVLHDRNYYDYPSYNGAYDRAKAAAEEILAEYPTIQMILDVHRDALVAEDGTIYKPVTTVDGEKTAQVMLLVGTDDGGASFPDWGEHLALAMELYGEMNSLWPNLARPITLRSARFNQQLTKGSLLVEVGSHGSTLEEALAGARLFARAAGQVILSRTEGE